MGQRSIELERRLEQIVRSTEWLMRALFAAREVGAPDWLIAAGAVRTAVWDRLHGYRERTPLADIDLAFFDPHDVSEGRERHVAGLLARALPDERWDARNQARVHLWYEPRVEPLASSAAAVATFPETASCVALRLTEDDDLLVVAPHGLDDLLGMVHRHNPARASIDVYERRLAAKRIGERWPRVHIVPASTVIG